MTSFYLPAGRLPGAERSCLCSLTTWPGPARRRGGERTLAPITDNTSVVIATPHSIGWGDDVSAGAKQQYRQALDALRGIPELLHLTWGDDAGHFDGNFDLVAVMDFAVFASARVYVEHPLHQAYVRDHASKVIGDRVVVQHDWTPDRLGRCGRGPC